MDLEFLPLKLKDRSSIKNINKLYYKNTCNVSVNWLIYDFNKQTIRYYGANKPCGSNHNKTSVHAEQLAIQKYIENKKNNKSIIVIWRWTKQGEIKTIYSCNSCIKLIYKYNLQDKVYTINDNKLVSSINVPYYTLSHSIRHNNHHD